MELLTVQETAAMLRVAPITVRRYIAQGRLPAVRIGKGVRVEKKAAEQLATPISPQTTKSRAPIPKDRTFSFDDPLWELVGSATDARPSDSSKKHEYLAESLDG